MKNTLIFACLIVFTLSQNLAYAQQGITVDKGLHSLTISSTGETLAPADIANFAINISINDENVERAFELHKEREAFLADLLAELEFEDEKINYLPVSIRPNRQRDGAIHSTTSQQISLELDDIEMLSTLQKTLIQNGFDNFSGNFSSTKMEEAGNEALRQAVRNARTDAEILAEVAGRSLGKIISIDHTTDRSYRSSALSEAVVVSAMRDSGPSMFDFSQTVSVQKRVTIVFELVDVEN